MPLVQLAKSRNSAFRRVVRGENGEIERTHSWEPGDVIEVPWSDLRVLADDLGKTLFAVRPDPERPGKFVAVEVDYDEMRATIAAGDFDEEPAVEEPSDDPEPGEEGEPDDESGQASDSVTEEMSEAGTNPAQAEGGSDGENTAGRSTRRRR
jgi:hypothetical protein